MDTESLSNNIDLVAHCDWSGAKRNGARKRQMAIAAQKDKKWVLDGPKEVGDPGKLLNNLRADLPAQANILVGFDFPIGVPMAWANKPEVGKLDFLALLRQLRKPYWKDFFKVAESKNDISIARPFYPNNNKGGKKQADLCEKLQLNAEDLFRKCDNSESERKACHIFWTLGANQVGKAALHGWEEVILPALEDQSIKFWPFQGTLAELLNNAHGITVVAETYPAEFYGHLGLHPVVKSDKESRDRAYQTLLNKYSQKLPTILRKLKTECVNDDEFDAIVGLFGMLNIVMGEHNEGTPPTGTKNIEGWILGR